MYQQSIVKERIIFAWWAFTCKTYIGYIFLFRNLRKFLASKPNKPQYCRKETKNRDELARLSTLISNVLSHVNSIWHDVMS